MGLPEFDCIELQARSIPGKKAYESDLKDHGLVPDSLDEAHKWKSKEFKDMDTLQKLVEKNPGDICCTSLMAHYHKFAGILDSKTILNSKQDIKP